MFKAIHTHTHTHTQTCIHTNMHTHRRSGQLQQGRTVSSLVSIRPTLECVDVCVIPLTPPHLWVGYEILNTLVVVVYFHH